MTCRPLGLCFSPSFSLERYHPTNLRFLPVCYAHEAPRIDMVNRVTVTHSRVPSLLRRDRFMNHLPSDQPLPPTGSSPFLSPSSLSLFSLRFFLSRNPSRTYRFTRSVYIFTSGETSRVSVCTIKKIPCGAGRKMKTGVKNRNRLSGIDIRTAYSSNRLTPDRGWKNKTEVCMDYDNV